MNRARREHESVSAALASQCGSLGGQSITALNRLSASTTSLFLRTNPPGFFNRYNGMVLAVEKRMSHSWQANFSYTLSKSEGCTTNQQDPNALVNCAGLLGTDRTHVFSTNGLYHFTKLDSFIVYAVVYAVYFFPWRLAGKG